MKVTAFNGSPRREGNTYQAIRMVAGELEKAGIEVEVVQVGDNVFRGCQACNACAKLGRCVFNDDGVNVWIEKMKESDGVIFGSPVYFAGINGTMKSFLDRAGYVLSGTNALRFKVGVPVAVVRRTGGMPVIDMLNHYFNYFEMISPGSNYWNVIHGRNPGEVVKDEEGAQIMRVLGKNMAWLMKVLEHGKDVVPKPETEAKIGMSFIR